MTGKHTGKRSTSGRGAGRRKGTSGIRGIALVWKRMSPLHRVLSSVAATLVVLLVMTLTMGAIRYAQYLTEIHNAQERQQQFAREYSFNPGNIISDTRFFDSNTMNAKEIQSFLDEKGTACTGKSCLKNYTVDTQDKAADALCKAYKGASKQSAATIIDEVSKACGISQKVLLTLLQKEQHLVTATAPTAWQYKAAMGLSCPDDADCDPNYAGFFKQVYGSASRFKYYQAHQSEYSYAAQELNYIQYSPTKSCGGANVYIDNEATALLYIYTPYQPNAAALNAGFGEGNSCSSYGNRNFSLIYANWFGNPRA
ncbi:MAG: hemagglutinin [Bifidobacterium psychraerophilum]|uniref:hemagglutinin n=1 Tax=Bifidobacterium psychraerophilum TaxID=218140 RepID=UPI0039EA85F1